MRARDLILLCILIPHLVQAEKVNVDYTLYDNGSVRIDDLRYRPFEMTSSAVSGTHCIALQDIESGNELGRDCFIPDFTLKGPAGPLDESLSLFWIDLEPPKEEDLENVRLTRIKRSSEFNLSDIRGARISLSIQGKKAFEADHILCDGDGRCAGFEDEGFCPTDCPKGGPDGYCGGGADGICDPDCRPSADSDCETGIADGICDRARDGLCDPDCGHFINDVDCRCGDGVCDIYSENIVDCPKDCRRCMGHTQCDPGKYCHRLYRMCMDKRSSGFCREGVECNTGYCIHGQCSPLDGEAAAIAFILGLACLNVILKIHHLYRRRMYVALCEILGVSYAVLGLFYLALLFSPTSIVDISGMESLSAVLSVVFIPIALCVFAMNNVIPGHLLVESIGYTSATITLLLGIVGIWALVGAAIGRFIRKKLGGNKKWR